MDSSADDEEQLATPEKDMNLLGYDRAEAVSLEAGDYRALLAMTRPLVIAKDTPLSLGVPICGDEAISVRVGDCHASLAMTPLDGEASTMFLLLMGD